MIWPTSILSDLTYHHSNSLHSATMLFLFLKYTKLIPLSFPRYCELFPAIFKLLAFFVIKVSAQMLPQRDCPWPLLPSAISTPLHSLPSYGFIFLTLWNCLMYLFTSVLLTRIHTLYKSQGYGSLFFTSALMWEWYMAHSGRDPYIHMWCLDIYYQYVTSEKPLRSYYKYCSISLFFNFSCLGVLSMSAHQDLCDWFYLLH